MKTTLEQLAEFLNKANKNTYAAGGVKSSPTRLGSEDFEYKEGSLTYHDTYFGSRNFIGEEVIYEDDKPIWGANYYGYIQDLNFNPKQVYSFLKEALMQEYDNIIPVRGPSSFKSSEFEYRNEVKGDLVNFEGKEQILYNGQMVYKAFYHGGFII